LGNQVHYFSNEVLGAYFPGLISLGILRCDLPNPISGGNKCYKLKYNLEHFIAGNYSALLTFGGAYSNHIAAVAYAGKCHGIRTVGIIRGEELNEDSNSILRYASECGMELVFVSRVEYKRRNDESFAKELIQRFGNAYILPEGGSNGFAVKGCKEILTVETEAFDDIVCPVGTGATIAGIISSAKFHQCVTGIAVLDGDEYLRGLIESHLSSEDRVASWQLDSRFTLGGYAHSSKELERFIGVMSSEADLPLDQVYSGKVLLAIHQMAKMGELIGRKVLFIHTGGYAFLSTVYCG